MQLLVRPNARQRVPSAESVKILKPVFDAPYSPQPREATAALRGSLTNWRSVVIYEVRGKASRMLGVTAGSQDAGSRTRAASPDSKAHCT